METVKQPTKQQLRDYLYGRHQTKEPPPTPEEIRRQLGWQFIPSNSR